MGLSPESLREQMSGKSNDDLYDILHSRSQDYMPETLEAARAEFSHRQLGASALGDIVADAEKVREKEEAHLSWPLRMLAFFVSSAILFIPVLLAHRHFVENGERCKAREWARWAIYGFAFYCMLGALIRVSIPRGN